MITLLDDILKKEKLRNAIIPKSLKKELRNTISADSQMPEGNFQGRIFLLTGDRLRANEYDSLMINLILKNYQDKESCLFH
jgi:hypothetical protein